MAATMAPCGADEERDLEAGVLMLGAVAGAREAVKDVGRYVDVVLRGLRPT